MRSITEKRIVTAVSLILVVFAAVAASASQAPPTQVENSALLVVANAKTGAYTLREKSGPAHLTADVAAKVNSRWLHSGDYPMHAVSLSPAAEGDHTSQLTIAHS